jgi:hypothetical protein
MTAYSLNRVRAFWQAVREAEQPVEQSVGSAPGVTGGNSPHYTNQPKKTKKDRCRPNIF